MPMLNGGKYDGRHSDWVPAEYLKTPEGRVAQGLPAGETAVEKPKDKAKNKPKGNAAVPAESEPVADPVVDGEPEVDDEVVVPTEEL